MKQFLPALLLCLLVATTQEGSAQSGPWAKYNNTMKGQALVRDADGGYLESVKSIVEGGGDVNWQLQPTGLSPLMAAASAGHTDIVRYLLDQGADPLLRDADGKTALDRARRGGANDIVKLLTPSNQKTPAAKPAAPRPATPAPKTPAAAPAKPAAPAARTTGSNTTWPVLGTYQPGDSVQFYAGGWKRGVIKEVGKSYNAASKNTDAFENKYLVAPDAYANWPDWVNWSQVVQPRREPFWTAWFVGEWQVGEVMAVTTDKEGSYERNVYSYHTAADVLQVNANGTYRWKPMNSKEITGTWSAAADGPGLVLHKGYRGLEWTLRNESSATTMHIRKLENARLYPSASYQTSMAANRPMK